MTSPARIGSPEEVLEALLSGERVVLTTHLNADGDGVGSQLALAAFLRSRGVTVHIVNPTPFPDVFRFLIPSGVSDLVLDAGSEAASDACLHADLAVVLDTGEAPRIGRVKPLIEPLPKVIIDHHEPGPQAIRGAELRDPAASAAGELVFEVIDHAEGPWTREIVDALYVAILTDTGSFRFSNSTPRCFLVASRLVELGARPDALHSAVFGNFHLRRYRLLREALGTLDVSSDGRVAWMVVPAEAYKELSASPEDLEGFVDVPRNLLGVEVALLFRAAARGKVKVSLRSTGAVDVNRLAGQFGGGGHVKASGALIAGEVAEVVRTVVAAAVEGLRERP